MRGSAGMTLIELLIALALAGFVAAAALALALASRDIYSSDRGRTDLNQSLRSGVDLLGMELRQAGERLPLDFPAIEIVDGGGINPDTLIVRRNVLDAVLPVCEHIGAGSTVQRVRISASSGSPPPGCSPVGDTDANGWPDNLDEWRAHRDANGGAIQIYLFNPVSGLGEFVLYDGDGVTTDYVDTSSGSSWQNTYPLTEQCRAYVLEQRTYEIDAEVLRFINDDDTSNPVNLIHDITEFQIRAVLVGGALQDSFTPADNWADLESIEITLSGRSDSGERPISRTVTTRLFPRNVLSL